MNADLHVERIWLNNSLRNYNYIVVCKTTKQAIVIDPFATTQILKHIKNNKWLVKAIVNTHDHHDHIAGNAELVSATGAALYAPKGALIDKVTHWLSAGDKLDLSESINFKIINTPGHTYKHISLLSNTQTPRLFCGDTIFNAGAGNVYGGDANVLFKTFECLLKHLSDNTQIYPGHDYMQTNLEFTLSLDPDNTDARDLLDQANRMSPENQLITTIGQEKLVNPFMRLSDKSLLNYMLVNYPDLGSHPDRRSIFLKLRELRNNW